MPINTNPKKIEELLTKNVEEVINKEHLKKRLLSGDKLRIKFGVDPTSADLHLGHSLAFKKLKEFQEFGHQVIFLIGDFTAQIGDPSARMDKRRPLSKEQIEENMKDYIKEAGKILNMKKVEVRYNSEWYKKKKSLFLMDLTSRFTFARLIERSEFKQRIKKDIDISMLELIYPLLQGYDSIELKADVEIGGTDQKFNLLMGRKAQKKYKKPQQDIITIPLLIGSDGVRKMSKSYKNYIGLNASPKDMYGGIMAIADSLVWHYFKLLTDMPLEKIEKTRDKVYKVVLTIKQAKSILAKEIVTMYHGKSEADKAEKEFNKVFKDKQLPSDIKSVKIKEKKINILDLLVKTKLASSKGEARRTIIQNGVKIDNIVENDWKKTILIKSGMLIQVGKRKFIKLA